MEYDTNIIFPSFLKKGQMPAVSLTGFFMGPGSLQTPSHQMPPWEEIGWEAMQGRKMSATSVIYLKETGLSRKKKQLTSRKPKYFLCYAGYGGEYS